MTQKELLYLEDAISHEQIIIDELNCLAEELDLDVYKNFITGELDIHFHLLNRLIELLEEEC